MLFKQPKIDNFSNNKEDMEAKKIMSISRKNNNKKLCMMGLTRKIINCDYTYIYYHNIIFEY